MPYSLNAQDKQDEVYRVALIDGFNYMRGVLAARRLDFIQEVRV